MSKILDNTTGAPISISDTGQTIDNITNYTIPATDYLLWAASDDIITQIGNGNIVVNDGSSDLGISEGIDLIKGIFPKKIDVGLNSPGARDSFGRLRVVDINNVFESTHANSEQSEFWDTKLVGGATKTYVPNKAQVELAVGTASGDNAIRQTMNYFHYAAGQSLIIRLTGVLTSGKNNLNSCVGYYDDENGLIFRTSNGVFQVGKRSFTTGSVVETWVDQADFNGDKLDGTGASGLTIDLDKTQIFEINFQWLGVGSVKFFVHINGEYILIHTMHNANLNTEVYMTTPHLPIRYEIKNMGVTSSATTMTQICTQIGNEGKSIVGDLVSSVDTDTNTTTLNSSTFKSIISMRTKSANDILIQLESLSLLVTTQDDIIIHVTIDQTLASTTWVSADQFVEKDLTSNIVTDTGRRILTMFISKNGNTIQGQFKEKFRLGKYIDGTKQTVTISGKTFSNNASVAASLVFKELF